jgi:uncharacterized protein YbgA (DUF1722 family)/uncharacterized protein YbbK (DUF523 family)
MERHRAIAKAESRKHLSSERELLSLPLLMNKRMDPPASSSPVIRKFPRPRVVVSRCITFDHVRYDGSIIPSDIVERMKPFVDFIPVCPEVEIGLGIPRDPIRIVRTKDTDRLVQPATGRDLTGAMEKFAKEFLDRLPPVDGFILKYRSPSSGRSGAKVYPSAESSSPIARGPGMFGRAVLDRFSRFPVEDEGRLRNGRIRDHFLSAIFTLTRFREAKEGGKVRDLVRFHTENKLLLMAASERGMRAMGRVVANREGKAPQEVFALYEDLLLTALRRPPRYTANINVLTHAEGYFRDRLTKREKEFFEMTLGRYREGLSTVSEPKTLVLSWIARFGEPNLAKQGFGEPNLGKPRFGDSYLEAQTYFSPYPEGLVLHEGEAADREQEYW